MATTGAQLANILPYFPAKDLSAFHVEALLGGGGFSHVVLARDAAGKEWALKLIPAPGAARLEDVDSAPLLLTEARTHLLLSGEPSVLPCMEAFKLAYFNERGGGPSTYMAVLRMPVAACSVEEWLFSASPMPHACQGAPKSQVEEAETMGVWLQMVNAVHRCHSHGIVHKDIKLPNFLMDGRGKVQIMDFGLAQVEGVTPRAVAGTPWTMSPAGLKHGDDGRAGDWWALGVVLYQLLQGGAWPFKHCWWPWQKGGGERMEAAIRRAVLSGRITFQDARVSEPLKALIRGLLQPDPNRRWQLRQVLACEAVRPDMLVRLGERFPELRPDMQALLQVQSRARDLQALGSDSVAVAATAAGAVAAAGAAAGAAAAGLATAGSVLVAAASTVLRGGVSLVGEGGLHWPHWRGEPPSGSDGSSHRPLLDGQDQEEEATARGRGGGGGEPLARGSGPSAPLEAPRRLSEGIAQPPSEMHRQVLTPLPPLPPQSQQRVDVAHATDLLLMFSNELPNAHPSPPGTPRADGRSQVARDASPAAAAATSMPAASAPGLVPMASCASGFEEPSTSGRAASGVAAALTSPVSSAAVGSAGFHHAYTTSLTARTGSDLAARGASDTTNSGRAYDGGRGGGGADTRRTGSHPQTPHLSRRSLSGPQGSPLRGSGPLAAHISSPSPHSRRSRTSLHDLFGAPFGPLQAQPSLQRHSHQHPRPASGTGLGGLLGTAADFLSGGSVGGHHPRGPWVLQRRSAALLQPLETGLEGEEAEPTIPPQSSWVPPPPESFAAAAIRRGDGSATSRHSANGRAAAAGTGSDLGAAAPRGPGGAPHAQHHAHNHSGLLAKARRLFFDCLQRPGVKYDMYDALPTPVPRKAQ